MAITFATNVSWGRNILIPLGLYPKIIPKKAVTRAPFPIFRTLGELKALAPSTSLMGRTSGYTELTFQPRFDPNTCFRSFADGTRQFVGGSVSLALGVTIYLYNWFDPQANPHKLKKADVELGFAIAMSHELDHMIDAFDVLDRQLPDLVSGGASTAGLPVDMQKTVKYLRELLVDAGNGQPAQLAEVDYTGWFTPRAIYQTEDGRTVNRFEDSLINLFNDRYTTQMDVTDSDKRHAKIEGALSMIQGGTGNLVVWP